MKGYKLRGCSSFLLAGDIGGTNTTLGVFAVKNEKPILIFSMLFESNKLDSLSEAINVILSSCKERKIKISSSCLGVAGPVSVNRDFCSLTYVKWKVNTVEIFKKTSLKTFLINDFEAVGYGINMLGNRDLMEIGHKRKALPKATKAVIGAGTGLGKSILVYQDYYKAYIPIPSEGGFSDFSAQNEFELSLVDFIKKRKKINGPISWEEVISGKGIESIYLFLRPSFNPTRYTSEISKSTDKVPLIAKYKNKDSACRETFRLYARFYARCAKNFVLDSLARGGLYIAGGIASKNNEIFKSKGFIREFERVNKQPQILKKVPIYVILNYNAGLYGAAYAAMERGMNF